MMWPCRWQAKPTKVEQLLLWLCLAATLSESHVDDVALPLAGQTDESEAVIVVAVLTNTSTSSAAVMARSVRTHQKHNILQKRLRFPPYLQLMVDLKG